MLHRDQGALVSTISQLGGTAIAGRAGSAPSGARNAGVALLLDPDTPQLDLAVGRRDRAFRKTLSYGRASWPKTEPDFSTDDLTALSQEVLEEQVARGATAVVTPYRLAPANGRDRTIEVLLARAAAKTFQAGSMAGSAEEHQPARQLLVGIMLDVRLLPAAEVEALVAHYCEIQADGYWVRLAHFNEGTPPDAVSAGTQLLRSLQERSGRPVVCCCPGELALPLIAGGIAGVSIGMGRDERTVAAGDEARAREEEPLGHDRVYHHGLARSLGRSDAQKAFRTRPCECGQHRSGRPPRRRSARDDHNCRSRLVQARELASLTRDERIERVRTILAESERIAQTAGLPGPQTIAVETVLATLDGAPQ